ncbi:hypothetical protein DFH09DRAFT_1067701 [Mycena vulgaris]|nr:hypothetical protein DFH09DRAFT_1067701 [Mycena vulgaris]
MATIDIDSDLDILPVDQMIQEVIRENPTGAFLPGVLAANLTIQQRRRTNQLRKDEEKKKKKKRKQLTEDEHEVSGSRTKKPKARKSKPANDDEDEDDDEDKNVPFTIYVDVLEPPLPTSSRNPSANRRVGKTMTSSSVDPYTKDSYSYFLSKLAEVLPCHVDNIHQSKVKWKPQKPANGKLLPIGGATGYEAIQDAMREKTKERVILINMPAPAAPMDEPTAWVTGVEEKPAPAFDYLALKREDSMNSFQQQKTTFNDAIKTEKEKLEAEYPIGNNPLFPELRVYYDPKTKYYFDLTPTKMGVWASHMLQGKAEVKTAPASRLFDANQRIKNVPGQAPGSAFPITAFAAPAAPAAPAPLAPAPALSLLDLLLASLLGQQGGGLGALFPHLNTGAAPLSAHRSTPTSPVKHIPSPVKRHNVTAEEFCAQYNIKDTDCTRLKDVEFRPSDHTDSKLDDCLKEAGFTFFGWKRIHQANTQFKADLAGGLFDA